MAGSRTLWLGLTVSLLTVVSPLGLHVAQGDAPSDAAPAGSGSSTLEPGLIPAFAQPNGAVTERQLAALAARLGQRFGAQTVRPVEVQHPFAPVNRLRVLVALVKLGLVGDNPVTLQPASEKMPPDAASIPAWGTPYVAAAVEQGWWPGDRPLHARDVATWTFVKAVLTPMITGADAVVKGPSGKDAPTDGAASTTADPAPIEHYTGLVLDARGLDVQRAMGPRVLDEDGQVLYPDPNHVPDMEFLQDHGMVAYVTAGQDAPRSGSHPLAVSVISVTGPGHDDVVVSRDTARQIREAAARDGFLGRWAVSILIGPR